MPSTQMSCVDEAKAITQSRPMMTVKKFGRRSAMAIIASSAHMMNSIDSTQNFFVRYMSRNSAQSGLSDQAMPIPAVTGVITASE